MNEEIIRDDIKTVLSAHLPWEKLYGKTVLISGASGFIASFIVKTLLTLNDTKKANIRIIGLVRGTKSVDLRLGGYKNRKDLKIIIHNLVKPIEIKERIDFIIHAASQASPKFYSSDPVGTLLPNVLGTYNLLELARIKNPEGFFFVSSGEVYGELIAKDIPTGEESSGFLDPVNIRSCYGESKRMGENMCVSYAHQYGLETKIARLFHVYGPGMVLDDGRVQADFVSNIVKGEDIVLKSSGSDRRTFCYITDAVRGILTVLLKGERGQAYNIGNNKEEITIKDLAEKLGRIFPEKKLKVIKIKREENDRYMKSSVKRVCPDTGKIERLGWKATVGIKEGFVKMVNYYL